MRTLSVCAVEFVLFWFGQSVQDMQECQPFQRDIRLFRKAAIAPSRDNLDKPLDISPTLLQCGANVDDVGSKLEQRSHPKLVSDPDQGVWSKSVCSK